VDSELKEVYKIDDTFTWADQRDDIVTKLLLPLCKLVNKKYDVSNNDLLKMQYGRWRSRHHVNNIKNQGEEQVKRNNRRIRKNTKMQNVNYLINRNFF
jgi:hypothetical protein